MSVTGAVIMLIVGVLIWLAISAGMLFRAAKRTTRRLNALKEAPLFQALENGSGDLEKLKRVVVELHAQLAALSDAQARLTISLGQLRKFSLGSDLAFVRRAYAELATTLR